MDIWQIARTSARSALELVLPSRCAGCNALHVPDQAFCPTCDATLEPIHDPCERCGRGGHAPLCGRCMDGAWAYSRAFAPHAYGGQLARAIRRLKFEGATQVARVLAPLLAAPPLDLEAEDRPSGHCYGREILLVPVPLHASRLRQRGYNQATLLARHLSARLRLPLSCGALARTRSTPPQVEQPGANARWHNVQGAFRAVPRVVAGRRVALVDDVMTTGATANACAEALRRAGACDVWVLVLARAEGA